MGCFLAKEWDSYSFISLGLFFCLLTPGEAGSLGVETIEEGALFTGAALSPNSAPACQGPLLFLQEKQSKLKAFFPLTLLSLNCSCVYKDRHRMEPEVVVWKR